MPTENVTTKFKVDISDLKQNISTANNQIKLLNAEMKNVNAGMEKGAETADTLTAKIQKQQQIVEAEKTKLAALKEQLQRLTQAQTDGEKTVSELTAKYNEAAEQYGENSEQAKKYAKELAQAQDAQDKNAQAIERLNVQIVNQDTAVKNAQAQVGRYETALNDLEKESEESADSTEDLTDNLKDVKSSTDKAEKGFTTLKGVLSDLIASGVKAAIKAFGDLAKSAVDTYKDMETGSDNLIKATGATGDAAKDLQESYKNVSKEIVGDFGDIGSAMGEVNTRFGYTGEELENTTEQFLKFADITGTDATQAVQIVSKAIEGAGLESSDYSELLDQLAVAAQASGVSVDKLADGITKNGSTMRSLGFDTSETIAIIAQMEKAGVNTETAFAGMKKAAQNWAKDGKEPREEFAKTIEAIKNAPNETKAAELAFEAFGNKAGVEMAESIRTGRFEYADFLNIVSGSEGTVTKTYEETQSSADKVKLAMQNLKVSAADLVGKVVSRFSPQIEKSLNTMKKVVDKVFPIIENGFNWIMKNGDTVATVIAGVGTAIATFMIIVNKQAIITAFVTGLTAIKTAFTGLWAVLAANPIGLIVAAVAGLVAAFVVLWNKSEAFREFWLGLWENIKAVWDEFQEAFQIGVDTIVNFFITAWENVKLVWSAAIEFFTEIWNGIQAVFSTVAEWFGTMFTNAWKNIKKTWDTVKAYFKKIWDGIRSTFSVVKTVLTGFFTAAWNGIKAIWDGVTGYFKTIWENIKLTFSVVKNVLKGDFSGAWDAIKQIWDNVVSYFKNIWDGIKSVFSAVSEFFKTAFSGAWTAVKNVWTAAGGFFGGIWGSIQGVFGNVGSWFKSKFTTAWNNIKSVFSGVGTFFGGIWDTIKSKFTSIGTKVGDAIGGAFKSAINSVLETVENAINAVPDAINGALDVINEIPGVNIPQMGYVSLPRLAKGGIVKKSTLANIGENGSEAIIPLENNKAGLRQIANLLADEMAGGTIGGAAAAGDTIYNFNQTNNSPKALSRYEIYRQTKNLINAAKMGV